MSFASFGAGVQQGKRKNQFLLTRSNINSTVNGYYVLALFLYIEKYIDEIIYAHIFNYICIYFSVPLIIFHKCDFNGCLFGVV